MEKIYIDEQYDYLNHKTHFSILRIDDVNKKLLYSKVKSVILKKEQDRKTRTFLLTELKLHKLKNAPYFAKIIQVLSEITYHEIISIDSTKENNNFSQLYIELLQVLWHKYGIQIVIDRIDTSKYTDSILNQLKNINIISVESYNEKGIQLADLLLYKITKVN